MKRILSATFGLAALGVMLVGCSTTSSSSSLDRGNMFYRNSEYVSAVDAFSEAIAKSPRSAAAWNNRAAARLRLGDVNGAIADYNKAVELAPNDAEIYYNRANALVAAGQYQEAIADYTRAITLNSNYAKAIYNRGTAYAMLGQRDAAQADWSRAIALEPDPWAEAAMRRGAGAGTGRARAGLARDHPRARWRSRRRPARPQDRHAARAGRVPPRVARESDSAAGYGQIAGLRAFVAVLLPDDLRQRLATEIERLRPLAAAVAWVAPANLHVTLKFLGQVDEARAPAIADAPRSASARHPAFNLAPRGRGAFPS